MFGRGQQTAPAGYAPLAGGDLDDLGSIRQPDFSADSTPAGAESTAPYTNAGTMHSYGHTHYHDGHHLIASCPKCMSQLMIPPGVPTVACGSCGQAISPVTQVPPGGGAPAGPRIQAQHDTRMVKCPLCAAVLQQPPGAQLAICGGCHQVIAMPGGGSAGVGAGGGDQGFHAGGTGAQHLSQHGYGGGVYGNAPGMPPLIACPSCNMRLQPPPGAPLVACGGCRQVMQVPGVA